MSRTWVDRAREEFREDGIVHVDTMMALEAAGVDVETLIDNFEQEGL